jgi:copper chaperone CopZ
MKYLGLLLLLCAGGILAWLGLRASEPTYVAPRLPADVPVALSGELPPGCEVRTFDVAGMCCSGCSAKLYAALTLVDGVRAAAIDVNLGTAEVVVPTDAPTEPLLAALAFDAYNATLRR